MKSFDTKWDEIHSTTEWGAYPTEHVIRFIARNYYKADRKNIKILDFGCGGGAHTWYLAREGFNTYAFDGSKNAIELTKKRLNNMNLSAHLDIADGLELEYENCYFDAIIDNVCIYANIYKNIIDMYKKTYDILKPGGKMMTACFGKRTLGFGIGEKIEDDTYDNIPKGVLFNRGITHFFDKDTLYKTLTMVGFKKIDINYCLYEDNYLVEHLIAVVKK